MIRLKHEFKLVKTALPQAKITDNTFEKLFRSDSSDDCIVLDIVRLQDELINPLYIALQWIPMQNPCFDDERRRVHGICRHGISLYDRQSAALLIPVMDAFLHLFTVAPERINLFINEEPDAFVTKEHVLTFCQKIKEFSQRVLTEDGCCIFHEGI